MASLAATLALVAPLAFSGDPIGPTAVPMSTTFPERIIQKGETALEWPFSIDQGTLTCIASSGQRYVFFSEILTEEEMGEFGAMTLPRMVVVTANPLAFLATVDNSDLYLPWDTLETLIKRLAPYERMGWKLCEGEAASPPSTDL